ncbi:hypothetical protein [Paenibacillus sp. LPE1-1-1.1]|uniref:hypothetical protein n=1 Tax=Paenibacillus sp. LPE1-1-1.1 TaxID=3135230 RepID=UPI003429590E
MNYVGKVVVIKIQGNTIEARVLSQNDELLVVSQKIGSHEITHNASVSNVINVIESE